jgi:hypothetical protein
MSSKRTEVLNNILNAAISIPDLTDEQADKIVCLLGEYLDDSSEDELEEFFLPHMKQAYTKYEEEGEQEDVASTESNEKISDGERDETPKDNCGIKNCSGQIS